MQREEQVEQARKLLACLDARTAAMADGVYRNPVRDYTCSYQFAQERELPCSHTGGRAEDARDVARALAKTEAFEQSRRSRKRVEMLFAHLKRILRLGRLRLRGPRGAQDEFTLAAVAQNLRRLAKLVARPPPAGSHCLA
jgi:hypothetical protein